MFDEKGEHERDRSRDSSETVNQNIGPLDALVDISGSLMEVLADIKGLMILSRDIEEVRNIMPGMINLNPFCSGQQRTNLQF
jgi:hypothetical protein